MIRPDDGTGEGSRGSSRPFRQRGLLVIDDNEAVRAFLGAGLGASGFTVWLAAGGHEGVATYQEHASAIDLLLLDVRMPGWDGPLTTIHSLAPHVPCCFMSGDTGRYTEAELLGLGAVAVLPKPFQLGELIAQLGRLMPDEQRVESQE